MNRAESDTKLKCVTVMVFEKQGKTILQPIIRGQESQHLHDLFKKNTLEVWIPNGGADFEEFDVGILRYTQVSQPNKPCSKTRNTDCLKNHFETIVSCEQCPRTNKEPQTQSSKKHAQPPTYLSGCGGWAGV